MQINDRAVLVQLSISQWTARKLDKKVSTDVAASNGAVRSAGNYNKALLPSNDSLTAVHKYSTLIRNEFYAQTLPWGLKDTHILPSSNFLPFMTMIRGHRSTWGGLVAVFLNDYGRLCNDAQRLLGALYDADDYPPVAAVRGKFDIDLAVLPIPTNDFRVQLSDTELSGLQADMQRRTEASIGQAMQEAWSRLYDRVQRIAERLSDPDNKFHDSLIENAREITELLTRLNFNDDPHLEALRVEVERKLTTHGPEVLRDNKVIRAVVASDAQSIMSKMGAFMGSPS